MDRGELRPRTYAVAVPVLDADNIAIAAIEIELDDVAPETLADLVPTLALAARCFRRELAYGLRSCITGYEGRTG